MANFINKITFSSVHVAIAIFIFAIPATTFAQAATAEKASAETATQASPIKIHRGYRPKVGEPHRDFILPSIDDGKNLQLSDYRGKKVLLLHFASW